MHKILVNKLHASWELFHKVLKDGGKKEKIVFEREGVFAKKIFHEKRENLFCGKSIVYVVTNTKIRTLRVSIA